MGTGPCWAHGWCCWRWCWLPAASLVRGKAWEGRGRRPAWDGQSRGQAAGEAAVLWGKRGDRMEAATRQTGRLGLSRGEEGCGMRGPTQAGVSGEGPGGGWGLPLPGGHTHQEGLSAQGENPAPVWGHGAGQSGGQVSGGALGRPGRRWGWGGRGWTRARQAQTRGGARA